MSREQGKSACWDRLTPMEREVARFVLIEGCEDGEAAALCYVSRRTIQFHIANIYAKVRCYDGRVRNRIRLRNWLVVNGWIDERNYSEIVDFL